MDPVDMARYRVWKTHTDGRDKGDEMTAEQLKGDAGDKIRAHISANPEPGTVNVDGRGYRYEYRDDTSREARA